MTLEEFLKHDNNKYYCEIVIKPDGTIEYAEPAHLYKMIRLSGYSKEDLNLKIPTNASPIHWMCEFTGTGCIWYNTFIMPNGITIEQINTMEGLAEAGKIHHDSSGTITSEMSLCNAMLNHELDKIESLATVYLNISELRRYYYEKENSLNR